MKENSWNLWLRNKLPDAFMQLFTPLFKQDPKGKLQNLWVRFLPSGNEVVDDFFKHFVVSAMAFQPAPLRAPPWALALNLDLVSRSKGSTPSSISSRA